MAGATGRRERLLVVGGGMASLKLVEELLEQCPGRYEIVVAAKEPRHDQPSFRNEAVPAAE